jgi:hypothetical protein
LAFFFKPSNIGYGIFLPAGFFNEPAPLFLDESFFFLSDGAIFDVKQQQQQEQQE